MAERYFPNFQDIENMDLSIIQKFVLDDPERTEFLERFIDFDISEEFTSPDSLCVVISVIDNNKTRKSIHALFKKCVNPHVILDAGNEDVYGQVTLSSYYPHYAERFKNYWEIHPEMEEFNDGVKAGPSCAEHDEEAANAGVVQTMSANTVSANIVTSYLEKLVRFDFSVENETKFTFSEKTYTLSYY